MVIRSKRHTSQYNLNLKQDFESEVLQGCRNLIHTSTTELSICPDTGRKFIVNNDIHIKMVIVDDKIIISNSIHYRELPISDRGLESINRVFNGHLRKSIAALDSNIKSNAQHTLNDVTILTSYLQ
jgi:hypothetical protein